MKTKLTEERKAELIAQLQEYCKASGYKLYTILRHCSKSGMSRIIEVLAIPGPDKKGYNSVLWLGGMIAELLEYKYAYASKSDSGGIKIEGCGMDMGFAIVYELSAMLYGKDAGKDSSDGPYKLQQQWL